MFSDVTFHFETFFHKYDTYNFINMNIHMENTFKAR